MESAAALRLRLERVGLTPHAKLIHNVWAITTGSSARILSGRLSAVRIIAPKLPRTASCRVWYRPSPVSFRRRAAFLERRTVARVSLTIGMMATKKAAEAANHIQDTNRNPYRASLRVSNAARRRRGG